MAELPPVDPPERGQSEGASALSGLIKATATIGVLASAAGGSRILLKHLPPQVKIAAQRNIAKWGLSALKRVQRHPAMARGLNRAFTENPGVNDQVLHRALSEIGVRDLGLMHSLETISKLQGAELFAQDKIHKNLLLKYDMNIPQLREGAWRRATLEDTLDAATRGAIDLPNTDLMNINPDKIARKLGMNVRDLRGLRLSPYLMYNSDTGRIANLANLNLVTKALDWVENVKIMGIPIFKLRPDTRGDHLGMALFGRNKQGPDDLPHPLVKYLTKEDRGQLFVMDREVFYRKSAVDPFELHKELTGKWQLTTDYKASELGLRAAGTDAAFDELVYPGLKANGKAPGGLRGLFGFGPEYMPKGQASILAKLGQMNEVPEEGAMGWLKNKLMSADPFGIVGGLPQEIPKGFGTAASILTKTGADIPGQVYLRRTGIAGMADWLNVQAARPTYLLNQLGLGLRPGKNFITTMGKMSMIAAGAYMAKEAVSYADWATGNVASTVLGKGAGYLHLARQQLLESTGATGAIESLEDEFPGLISGSLSNIARFGALALGGAAIGRAVGGKAWMKKLLDAVAKRGVGRTGMGRLVARNMISNAGLAGGSGAIAGLIGGAGVGAALSGDLSRPADEIRQEIRGERQVEYRASAGWMLGRDPFKGGRIRFYRPSTYHSAGTDYTSIGVYGSEGNKWRYGSWLPTVQNWGGLRRLFNPYYAENRNKETRPYPTTSGHFGDYPIFGPLLQSTIGSILKPTRHNFEGFGIEMQAMQAGSLPGTASMNAALQAAAGSSLAHYTGDLRSYGGGTPKQMAGMGFGNIGLEPMGVSSSNSLSSAFANLSRNIQEYSGLRGFQVQYLSQLLTGSQTPGLDRPILASSGQMSSTARAYYGSEPGGLFGGTELLRRFLVRPSGQPDVNPIPNSLPRWLPGSLSMFEGDRKYYVDYNRGDPYTKIPLGEARLPGPGRDVLYGKHGGAAYDVVDSFLVLADVAPFTESYRIMKQEVERLMRQGKLSDEWVRKYAIAVGQAEQRAESRAFQSNRYRNRQTMTITEVLGPTKFRTAERPDVTISLEGTRLDEKTPLSLIAERQAAGMTAAQAQASVSANRQQLRTQLEALQGKAIDIDITGSSRGALTARIPGLESAIDEMGVAREDNLRDQGLLGGAYTAAGKQLGEAGFLAGLVYGIMRGGKGGRVIQAGSPAGRVIGALLPAAAGGIIGGWVENKFTGDFSAIEHYKRFQVYGSSFADWTQPYSAFIRPWMNTAASTVMDFTPGHRKNQYATEEYFDKLKYVKYRQLSRQAAKSGDQTLADEFSKMSSATLTGVDYENLSASTPGLYDALPNSERQYFKQFAAEQSPDTRQEIIDSVPDYMKSVYLSIWHNNDKGLGNDALRESYSKYVMPLINTRADERVAKYFSGGRAVPRKDWMGWHPAANLSDIKYRAIQLSGGNPHDHGLFSSQERRINAFTPWLNDVAEEVVPLVEPGLDVSGLRKIWGRISADGVVNTIPNFDGGNRAELRLFADDTYRYDDYYTQAAGGEVGIY